jgi:uncharacterized protein YodC (DUF2158 family)
MPELGDVVYLKSGGRPMTVVGLGEGPNADLVGVTWHSGPSLSRDRLPEAVLTTTDPEPALNDARRRLVEALDPNAEAIAP